MAGSRGSELARLARHGRREPCRRSRGTATSRRPRNTGASRSRPIWAEREKQGHESRGGSTKARPYIASPSRVVPLVLLPPRLPRLRPTFTLTPERSSRAQHRRQRRPHLVRRVPRGLTPHRPTSVTRPATRHATRRVTRLVTRPAIRRATRPVTPPATAWRSFVLMACHSGGSLRWFSLAGVPLDFAFEPRPWSRGRRRAARPVLGRRVGRQRPRLHLRARRGQRLHQAAELGVPPQPAGCRDHEAAARRPARSPRCWRRTTGIRPVYANDVEQFLRDLRR